MRRDMRPWRGCQSNEKDDCPLFEKRTREAEYRLAGRETRPVDAGLHECLVIARKIIRDASLYKAIVSQILGGIRHVVACQRHIDTAARLAYGGACIR